MENKMKRRSSFFRRDLEPEDESLLTTSDDTTGSVELSKTTLSEETIKQYIIELKTEQKEYVKESDNVKIMYKNHLKERKSRLVKVSKAEVYNMLSEAEKSQYSILFSREDYTPLLDSIETLKKTVALAAVAYSFNHALLETHLREDNNEGKFENLMNELITLDKDEILFDSCEGDEISDFLDSGSENEDVDME